MGWKFADFFINYWTWIERGSNQSVGFYAIEGFG